MQKKSHITSVRRSFSLHFVMTDLLTLYSARDA